MRARTGHTLHHTRRKYHEPQIFSAVIAATCCSVTLATAVITKDEHKSAIATAESSYRSAKTGCDNLAGNDKYACVKEAKVAYGK